MQVPTGSDIHRGYRAGWTGRINSKCAGRRGATADSTRPWFSSSYDSSRPPREYSSESEVNRPDCLRIVALRF